MVARRNLARPVASLLLLLLSCSSLLPLSLYSSRGAAGAAVQGLGWGAPAAALAANEHNLKKLHPGITPQLTALLHRGMDRKDRNVQPGT